MSERRTVKLARELESFRAAVRKLVGMPVSPRSLPTDVYLIDDPEIWKETSHKESLLGYFRGTWRRHVMAIKGGDGEKETMQHEYVHKLLADTGAAYPRWYNEGLAEFLETATVSAASVEVGRPPTRPAVLRMAETNRFDSRPPLNWEDPSRVTEDEFYARAWGRVNYLFLGDLTGASAKDRRTQVRRFIEIYNSGVPHDDAFEMAFGMSPAQLDRLVERHVAGGRYPWVKVRVDSPAADGFQTRSMPPAIIDRELGTLALGSGKLDRAAAYFERAREKGEDAQALSGLGRIRAQQEDPEEARRLFEEAVALDPSDPIPRLDYASFLLANAGAHPAGDVARDFEAARAQLAVAVEVAPDLPEAHALLGLYYLQAGDEPAAAGGALVRAAELLPGDAAIYYHLGRLYAEAGQIDDARPLLRIVHGRPHIGELSELAGKLLVELDRAEAYRRGCPQSYSGRGKAFPAYFELVRQRIAQEWLPHELSKQGRFRPDALYETVLEGTIGFDGAVRSVEVTKSSGVPALDEEAVRAFHAAAPFPEPPSDLLDGGSGALFYPLALCFDAREPPRGR